MQGFKGSDLVAQHYDENEKFAAVLNRLIPEFEYPDWSHRTIAQTLAKLMVSERTLVEDALNGWALNAPGLTERQEQFVSEHSGAQRSKGVREAIAKCGGEAMRLANGGDEKAARLVMAESGLSKQTVDLLLTGWDHQQMGYVAGDKPAVCCVVNAMPHKTYVGRIVRMADDLLWQEVEPGEIVEHECENLGEIPAALTNPYWRDLEANEIRNPWNTSCCITYGGDGKAVVKTAGLLLLDGSGVKPNPFSGCVVSETASRFVQENDNDVYAAHLKEMTGPLTIGKAYEITYRGRQGQQVVEVNEVNAERTRAKEAEQPSPHDRDVAISDALAITTAIFNKLNVVVIPQDIVECLAERRRNGSCSGNILDIDHERGLVVQSAGRQQASVHLLKDFAEEPAIGTSMDIKYRGGKIAMAQERGEAQSLSR